MWLVILCGEYVFNDWLLSENVIVIKYGVSCIMFKWVLNELVVVDFVYCVCGGGIFVKFYKSII